MKIYIQWATDPAQDWVQYDHTEWPNISFKPPPIGGEIIDSKPGWINFLNIQGIIFQGDNIQITEQEGKVVVQTVHNDPIDNKSIDSMSGHIFTFESIAEEPLSVIGFNPKIITTRFIGKDILKMPEFDEKITAHGIWMSDELFKSHTEFQPKPWMEWIGDKF